MKYAIQQCKNIINCFIGNLNTKFTYENTGFIPLDPGIAKSALLNNFTVEWEQNSNLIYICKNKSKIRRESDNTLIYQSVMWSGIFTDHLDENVGDYKILGANTNPISYQTNTYFTSSNNEFFMNIKLKISLNFQILFIEDFNCLSLNQALGLDDKSNNVRGCIDFDEYECIIINEIRNDPWLMSSLICKLRTLNGNSIMIGHSSQISCINNEKFDYSKCDCIGEIVGFNYFKLSDEEMIQKAKTGKYLYDLKTYLMLKHLEENKFMDLKLKQSLKTNICWSNKYKNKINVKISNNLKIGDAFIINTHYEEHNFYKGTMSVVKNFDGGLVNGFFKLMMFH